MASDNVPGAAPRPEVWLRGRVDGIPDLLQPVAHGLLQAAEEIARAATHLSVEEVWTEPGGAASVGFHLAHVAGSIDRLLTYARGAELDDRQRAALAAEAYPGDPPTDAQILVARATTAIASAIAVLRTTSVESLSEPRAVGRARLPSTVLGLLFHAAEHTQRHAGQIVTTAKVARALGPRGTA